MTQYRKWDYALSLFLLSTSNAHQIETVLFSKKSVVSSIEHVMTVSDDRM